jgi:hypothetical protein
MCPAVRERFIVSGYSLYGFDAAGEGLLDKELFYES